jgi:AcrR family transcriptional regulator
MARKYELKKRAERQQETRQRIAEAALALHSEQGPLRTTISAIADRAGVQRHTVYSHFPDELSLYMACSGVFAESNPVPAADALRAISDPKERLRAGLADLYQWFEGGEHLIAHLVREMGDDPVSQEVFELRQGAHLRALHAALADGVVGGRGHARARTAAALDLALDFQTWQTLTRGSGLSRDQAVEVMVRAVRCAGRT